jgi:hypothetical protein
VVTFEIGRNNRYWARYLSVTPDALLIGVTVFWGGTRPGGCAGLPTWQLNSWSLEDSGHHRVRTR